MAEISKFFNSTVTDERWYQAQDFAEYFWMFLTSGLIHVDREPFINVEVVEDSLQLKVTPGPALIKGHLYRNTKDLYLTVDTPDVLEDRFDRLVLQLDLVPEDGKAGRIKALIKKGVASNDPVVPELTRNERIFELSLGYFRVRKNTASIAQLDYVDERLHEDHCGIVNSLITAPTQAMQQQFDLWFNSIKAGVEGDVSEWTEAKQKEFDEWFSEIKDTLDDDVATSLFNKIDRHEKDTTAHGIGDRRELETVEKETIVGAVNELFTNVSDGKSLVGRAITDVDENVVIPTEPTFQDLAEGIGQINTGKKWASGKMVYHKTISGSYNNYHIYRLLLSEIPFKQEVVKAVDLNISQSNNRHMTLMYADFTLNVSVSVDGVSSFSLSETLERNSMYSDGVYLYYKSYRSLGRGYTIRYTAYE